MSVVPFEMQQPPSNADFDIITLNIDDDFPIDSQDDEILFKNDHQFDLASYIGGESTSLLLSPVNDASNFRHRIKSLNSLTHFDHNNTDLSRAPVNLAHDKVTKTPASNRRKRKNLSREFIETSDSDDDNKNSANNSINQLVDDSKRNKAGKKDDDPVWFPPSEKRNTKATKQIANHVKESVERNELKDIKNASTKPPTTGQGKGLRNMLKQQLLSDRPINQSKLLKTISSSIGSIDKANSTKIAHTPVKKLGVGRGKDIAITAKYYNCTESSDNNSERDKPYNHNRYHQIYTESEDSASDSDVDVSSEPVALPQVISKANEEISVVDNQRQNDNQEIKETREIKERKELKEYALEIKVEKKTNTTKPIQKTVSSKTLSSSNSNKPIIIDSSSLDSTEFAKALVTTPKVIPKVKSSTSKVTKKNHLEQQKRLIQSNLLLQNPSKFKMLTTDKSKVPSNGQLSCVEPKATAEHKVEPLKLVKELPKKIEKELPSEIPIKVEPKQLDIVVPETKELKEDVKPDVIFIEENKVEANAKRKLNVQEYLKRKNLKTGQNGNALIASDGLIKNIKSERIETEGQINSNQGNNENNSGESGMNSLAGNSMYEEIIIVSMGCNTDISIPEASFIQPSESKDTKSTVLLSDIQTSVEKATSKISCCSLISSIQDVILKNSHSMELNSKKEAKANENTATADGKDKAEEKEEHGENKVIMHLRKDRVRPMRISMSIQTDPYFQFPPLERWTPLSKKQMTFSEKRTNSIPRDSRSNEVHIPHSDNKNRHHRSYRNHLSESSYYSDEDEKGIQRPSRHSDFMEQKKIRHKRIRRESSRYSSSKYDRYLSRRRTISRSLSSSSDNSTTSTDSSSSSQSSSSSSTYVSSASARSLNSYGGSSSKSYYGDDHQYYRIRTTSNNSHRSNYRQSASKRTNSPGGFCRMCDHK